MKNYRILLVLLSISFVLSSCSRRYGHLTGFQFGSKPKVKSVVKAPVKQVKEQKISEVEAFANAEEIKIKEDISPVVDEPAVVRELQPVEVVNDIQNANELTVKPNHWQKLNITKSVAAATTKSKRIQKKLQKQLLPDQAKDGGLLYLLIVIILVLVIISLLAGILGKLWPVIATVLIVLLVLYLLGML